jgi:acyl-CoA reductase-like NAD-dependent aldehyde dehydrogenase
MNSPMVEFPLDLVVLPATAAFAAGNRVMNKMSEITPRTAELLKTCAANYFDPAELHVVTGGADVAAAFAALPDHRTRKIAPTIVRDVDDTMLIATERRSDRF